MGGCAKTFLNFIHTIVFLGGAVVTSISIYLLVAGNDHLPEYAGTESWYNWLPLASGLVVMLLAVLGCCCAQEGNWCILSIYALFQWFSGLFAILGGSIALVTVEKWMYNVITSEYPSQSLDSGINNVQWDFSDFVLGISVGCCGGESAGTAILECDEAATTYCYRDQEWYDYGVESAQDNSETCSLGDLDSGCSGTSDFLNALYDLLDDNLFGAGVALVVFGAILLVAGCCSCCLGCKSDKKNKNKNKNSHSQQAGTIAYGNQMTLA